MIESIVCASCRAGLSQYRRTEPGVYFCPCGLGKVTLSNPDGSAVVDDGPVTEVVFRVLWRETERLNVVSWLRANGLDDVAQKIEKGEHAVDRVLDVDGVIK